MKAPYRLSVGNDRCEIKGLTNTHIQCAVDRVAMLGGGEVELSEGTFHMADSLHLRSGVLVKGQGERTVLRKSAMKSALVSTYLGFGHNDIVVDHPERFAAGEGILIADARASGFYQTQGTLVRREDDTWFYSESHAHDYNARNGGVVKTLYSVVSAIDVYDARLEGVSIDGNAAENDALNGCRGGGFFAHRANRTAVVDVAVRNFNGEGFSFQTCDDLELDRCLAEACTGNGFHPGSGSNRFRIHHCRATDCGVCGLFYCLRVRDSVLEDCVFERNGSHGVSVGGRDTDHVNRRLTIRGNGGAGFFFRPGDRSLAAHRNRVEGCRIENNCTRDGEAEIVLQGETDGVVLTGNTIVRRADRPGILVKPEMPAFEASGNSIEPGGADAVLDMRRPVVPAP
jgi:hypothetical protein